MWWLCVVASIVGPWANARESDAFTDRKSVLALPSMGKVVSEELTDQVQRALDRDINANVTPCTQRVVLADRIYSAVSRALVFPKPSAWNTVTLFELLLEGLAHLKVDGGETTRFRMISTPLNQSIYRDFSVSDGKLLKMTGIMAGAFRRRDYVLGLDKVGHFLNEGLLFFQEVQRGVRVRDQLKSFQELERGVQGFTVSGIFSYADIAADFAGLLFWHNLVSRKDLDGKVIDGIISCSAVSGKFEVGLVDLGAYFTIAWDEAVNRSVFQTQHATDAVSRRVAETGYSTDHREVCKKLSRLPCADLYLNPDGCYQGQGEQACPDDLEELSQRVRETTAELERGMGG